MPLPICILIDDPAPLINVYWWHASRRAGSDTPVQQSGEPVAREIPLDFLDHFCDVIERWGIRGKFTVLPYPAGLGPIDRGWPGCDPAALAAWIQRVRRRVMPLMDISPEILTHAQALDLDSMQLLPETEREWSRRQTEATLVPYIALACALLERVGLSPTGVTSPWDFGTQVEEEYRTAIRRALAQATGRRQGWYFLHSDVTGTALRSEVAWRQDDAWLVSLWAQVPDLCWATMETTAHDEEYVASVADGYVSVDGRQGRLAELHRAGTPMVLVTHWQSLYANGRRTGLLVLDEVARRVDGLWGDQVRWTTCLELAAAIAEGRLASGGGRGEA